MPRLLVVLGLIALAGAAAALWPRDPEPRAADPCGLTDRTPLEAGTQATGQATLCLINRERTTRGLQALAENSLLSSASLAHSKDMVARKFFEHDTPEGRSVGDRLRAIGYGRGQVRSAGENLAWGARDDATPAAIVRIWMESPGHRADILRPAFTEIGIGIVLGAPVPGKPERDAATYTTDFGGTHDPSLPDG
jgi:uncharacterized protein YkwD